MRISTLAILIWTVRLCTAADISGDWVAQVTGGFGDPQYFRTKLRMDGTKLAGSWNEASLEGAIMGDSIEFSVRQSGGQTVGTFKGRLQGADLSGDGVMEGQRRGAGRGGKQPVTWKMTRSAKPPAGGPKTWDFEPKEFHGNYSASIPPVLRVFPGDTVHSRTIDTTGPDSKLRISGGNPETGPFYIEGALPGDTLVVKLNKVRVNRDSARSGSRINGRAVTPAYVESAEYSPGFDSEWKLDREKGIAMLAHPTERMKNYTVPILPMIGCIATAPASNQSFRAVDLGPFGGNMDYNQLGEGVTLYLPVFNPGALLFFGDGHAAMGDGELTGAALETSLDVEFTVDLVKGFSTGNPRLENKDYVMSVGVAGSVPDAIQIATSQLATWMKGDYKLNDSEVAILLGTALKYDIAELVDPHFSVVAKLPKNALAGLK
jgi:amidase